MKVLRDNVERHVAEEEKALFPLEAKLPKEVQEELPHRDGVAQE